MSLFLIFPILLGNFIINDFEVYNSKIFFTINRGIFFAICDSTNTMHILVNVGLGSTQVTSPTDLAIYGNLLYVVDKDVNQVKIFDLYGNYFGKIDCPEPTAIATDRLGNLYILQSTFNKVIKIGIDSLTFGEFGRGEGFLNNPCDIAIDDDKIYIANTGNKRIDVFDLYGNFLHTIGEKLLSTPKSITFAGDNLVVCDTAIILFTKDGKFIKSISERVKKAVIRGNKLYLLRENGEFEVLELQSAK